MSLEYLLEDNKYDLDLIKEALSPLKNKLVDTINSVKKAIAKPVNIKPSYYEYKALRLQGFSPNEAADLMREFNEGINRDDRFLFHFTNKRGASGITTSGEIYGSERGLFGPGVYTGTTSLPSKILMHTPLVGWGVGVLKYRIPIYKKEGIEPQLDVMTLPTKCVIIRDKLLTLSTDETYKHRYKKVS